MPESGAENKLDRAIDFSLGLLSQEEESALLHEASLDSELETMMRQQCACRERSRSEGFSSRHHARRQHAPSSARAALTRRRLATAASALAASIALVLWMLPGRSPDLYWLPVDGVLSTQRSSDEMPDAFGAAIEAYASRDLGVAIEALEQTEALGATHDLRNLYLASAMLNRGDSIDAARVLALVDLNSLPHPWRGYGQELERRIRGNINR